MIQVQWWVTYRNSAQFQKACSSAEGSGSAECRTCSARRCPPPTRTDELTDITPTGALERFLARLLVPWAPNSCRPPTSSTSRSAAGRNRVRPTEKPARGEKLGSTPTTEPKIRGSNPLGRAEQSLAIGSFSLARKVWDRRSVPGIWSPSANRRGLAQDLLLLAPPSELVRESGGARRPGERWDRGEAEGQQDGATLAGTRAANGSESCHPRLL